MAGVCSDIFVGLDTRSYERYIKDQHDVASDSKDKARNDDSNAGDEESDNQSDDAGGGEEDNSSDEEECMGDKDINDGKMHQSQDNFGASCPFEETAVLPRSYYGVCPLYKIDNGKSLLPVAYPVLYRFRGEAFRHYSRWEFTTSVRTIAKSKLAEGSSSVGRRKSSHFRFGRGCPLEESHVLQLRLKLCTPKLYSNPPPYPGEEPPESDDDPSGKNRKKWRAKANKFAFYFLAMFRPEDELYDIATPRFTNTTGRHS